ncbi:MAG TPA: CHC2 zinc finger domain-containing protein, partial [Planctomycetota bacterium]|nr:CHC2 zinc finger domain-containing protein [Planctomycetota bacterium]
MQSNQDLARAIEAIKARVSLEEVVRECVDSDFVVRSNRIWCNCPFHDENTPSFAMQPDLGLWYCFGACGEGGDLIQFVQRRHNTSFWDSLEWLAARAGVELPRRQGGQKKDDPAFLILKDAEDVYRSALAGPEGRLAREYLAQRGISAGAIEAFGIGYAPASGQTLAERIDRGAVRAPGVGLDLYLAAGLVRKHDSGRVYDFFRGRLMIPIRDDRGRTVGFGARRIDAPGSEPEGPKYINTPETPWFHKGRLIYGYDRASDEIRRSGHLVLMEGYTDVICAHQAGFRQACAVLGTATTEHHARLARRTGTRRI